MNNTEWNFTECSQGSNGNANLIRLSDIMEVSVCNVNHHGDAYSLGDLLIYRGGLVNYETDCVNLQKVYICKKHLKENGIHWARDFIKKAKRRGQTFDRYMFPAKADGFVTHTKPEIY